MSTAAFGRSIGAAVVPVLLESGSPLVLESPVEVPVVVLVVPVVLVVLVVDVTASPVAVPVPVPAVVEVVGVGPGPDVVAASPAVVAGDRPTPSRMA